jgi:hypothetical protein
VDGLPGPQIGVVTGVGHSSTSWQPALPNENEMPSCSASGTWSAPSVRECHPESPGASRRLP